MVTLLDDNDKKELQEQIGKNSEGISELKSDLVEFIGNQYYKNYVSGYINTSGETVDATSVTENNTYVCKVIDCTEGDKFTISLHGNPSVATAFCFIDDNGTKLLSADQGGYNNYIVTAPIGATKLVVNNRINFNPNYSVVKGTFIRDDIAKINECVKTDIDKTIENGNGYINKKGSISLNSKYGHISYHMNFGDKVTYSANVSDGNVLVGIGVYDNEENFLYYVSLLNSGNNNLEWTCDHNDRIIKSTYELINGYTIKFSNGISNDSENIGNIRNDVDLLLYNLDIDLYSSMIDKVVCIGDSITQGHDGGGNTLIDNYPKLIERMSGSWNCTNRGHGGLSATQYWNIEASGDDYSNYDTAIVYLGLNNGLAGEAGNDEDNEGSYRLILDKLKTDNPKIKIFLCTLHESYCATTNPIIKQIASEYDIEYIDLEPLRAYASDSTWHPYDNVHFSKKGYFYMASIIYKSIRNAIAKDIDKYAIY